MPMGCGNIFIVRFCQTGTTVNIDKTGELLLCCLGPHFSPKIVRRIHRCILLLAVRGTFWSDRSAHQDQR